MNYLFGLSALYERKLITKDGKNLRKYLEMKITGIICKNYNIPANYIKFKYFLWKSLKIQNN